MDIQTILANLKIEQLNVMQQTAVDAYREGGDLVLLSPMSSYCISSYGCTHELRQ